MIIHINLFSWQALKIFFKLWRCTDFVFSHTRKYVIKSLFNLTRLFIHLFEKMMIIYYRLGILLTSEILGSAYFIETKYCNQSIDFFFIHTKKGSLIWDFDPSIYLFVCDYNLSIILPEFVSIVNLNYPLILTGHLLSFFPYHFLAI